MAATMALSVFTPHLHKAGYTIRDEHAARTTTTMKFHQKSKSDYNRQLIFLRRSS